MGRERSLNGPWPSIAFVTFSLLQPLTTTSFPLLSIDDVFSWFKWEPVERPWSPDRYTGVDESLALLRKEFYEHGPFDGVIGFSQGGVMLSILTGMRAPRGSLTDGEETPFAFDFAIFAATFTPPVADYFYYTLKSNKCAPLASLHVYGSGDPLVLPENSEKLFGEYEQQASQEPTADDPKVHQSDIKVYKTTSTKFVHPGGHFVPTNGPAKHAYKEFIGAFTKDFGSS